MKPVKFTTKAERPIVIAGPCMAESKEIIREVAAFMAPLAEDLKFDWVFKASFDKANRTSIHSERGPGWEKASDWFLSIKEEFDCPVLTDIHETEQVPAVAEVCEFLQIPAFLCRQTDLLEAAVASGRQVNVKKGQFLAPQDTGHIVGKAKEIAKLNGLDFNLGLTERGTTFGYGNLVVDMRSFPIMAKTGAAVIFDVTHSLQLPSAAGGVSGGMREFAPHLARAAAATGCLDGFFIEVHPNPKVAKSDGATQLNFAQAKKLLSDVIGIWYQYQGVTEGDDIFMD